MPIFLIPTPAQVCSMGSSTCVSPMYSGSPTGHCCMLCLYHWSKACPWVPEGFNNGEVKGQKFSHAGCSLIPLVGPSFLPGSLGPTAHVVTEEAWGMIVGRRSPSHFLPKVRCGCCMDSATCYLFLSLCLVLTTTF